MKIKTSSIKDIKLFYYLRNSKKYRRFFFNQNYISFKDHQAWFRKQLLNSNIFMFTVIYKDKKVGYVRYKKLDNFYDVSIAIDSSFTKKGLATFALKKSEKKIKKKNIIFLSKVRLNNTVSQKLFFKSGYKINFRLNKIIVFLK